MKKKIKNKTKLIYSIRNDDGIHNEPSLIVDHVVSSFEGKITLFLIIIFFPTKSFLPFGEIIPNLVDDYVNFLLTLMPC